MPRRGAVSGREKMAIIIDATATMTKPLLFSMLIIVTSFLPIFFLGEREGRLFNTRAYSKPFARGVVVQSAGLQQDVRDGFLDAADAVPAADRHHLGVQTRCGASRRSRERLRARLPRGPAVDDPAPLRLRRRQRRDPRCRHP